MLNPYGLRLHREVFSAVTSSTLANNMAEFLAPNFQDAGQWPFLLALLLTVVLFAYTIRRPPLPWLLLIVMSIFFALRSFTRNGTPVNGPSGNGPRAASRASS